MFHAGGHKGINTRGRSSALSRHYPHLLNHVDWKAPLRCGIVFCTFSCILFVVGIILTWLGVHDVFGETVPITGPILLAVGGLMLILSFRQFYIAHTRKRAHAKALQNKELGVSAITAIVEQEDEQDGHETEADLQKRKLDDSDGTLLKCEDTSDKPQLITGGGLYDSSTASSFYDDRLGNGGYVWPPAPLQHPYYSMAMMVYKDPALFSAPYMSVARPAEICGAGPVLAASANSGGFQMTDEASPATSGCSSSVTPLLQQDMAVTDTYSALLQQQGHSPSCSSSTAKPGQQTDSMKIFPADYLTSCQYGGGVNNNASAGISSLPNPTAYMMLRTLELQETI